MTTLPSVSSLTKAKVERELTQLWGVAIPPEYNVLMLKELLKETRDKEMPMTNGLPNAKGKIIEVARAEGIALTGNETIAKMQMMVLEKRESEAPFNANPEGHEIYNLGKYKGKNRNLAWIVMNDPSFCTWAVETVVEGKKTSHPELVKLVLYIENHKEFIEQMNDAQWGPQKGPEQFEMASSAEKEIAGLNEQIAHNLHSMQVAQESWPVVCTCGDIYAVDAKFCRKCGKAREAAAEWTKVDDPTTDKKRTKWAGGTLREPTLLVVADMAPLRRLERQLATSSSSSSDLLVIEPTCYAQLSPRTQAKILAASLESA